jgi:hypothetical protein
VKGRVGTEKDVGPKEVGDSRLEAFNEKGGLRLGVGELGLEANAGRFEIVRFFHEEGVDESRAA